jgi:hypothetical protein
VSLQVTKWVNGKLPTSLKLPVFAVASMAGLECAQSCVWFDSGSGPTDGGVDAFFTRGHSEVDFCPPASIVGARCRNCFRSISAIFLASAAGRQAFSVFA